MIQKNVLKYLVKKGYSCFYNVSLGGKIVDLVAIKNNKITAFEFKKHALEIPEAIGHCLHYLNGANEVYIVIYSKEKDLISKSTIDTLKQYGIGLMMSDHKIEVLVKAKEFERDNISIINKIKEKEFIKVNNEKDIRKLIIDVLKKHSDGLTILSVAKLTGINRLTASKYLAILEAEKILERRKIGVSKIFKLRKVGKE